MNKTIPLTVNGTPREVTAAPNTPLIYVLRNDLDLKGTRFGCGEGVCGCCTVLLNGRSVEACNTPLSAAAIANAVFDAIGVRVRDLPLTPERVLKAVHAM